MKSSKPIKSAEFPESVGLSKPPSRVIYALKALVDLALHQAVGPVTVGTVAKRQGIPARYLEQLFNRLRKEGLVVAERGPRGGYRLVRSASEIPISLIFQYLGSTEQNRHSPRNRRDPKNSSNGPRDFTVDPTANVWKQVEAAVRTTLRATTLETLVAQARRQAPSDVTHPFTFHI